MMQNFWCNLLFLIPLTPLLLAGSCSRLAIDLESQSLSRQKGAAAQRITVNIFREGIAGNVDLSATGVPAGVNLSFNPASVGGSTSTMSISATSAAAIGSSVISVTGTTTGISSNGSQLELTIAEAPTNQIGVQGGTVTSVNSVASLNFPANAVSQVMNVGLNPTTGCDKPKNGKYRLGQIEFVLDMFVALR